MLFGVSFRALPGIHDQLIAAGIQPISAPLTARNQQIESLLT